MALPTHGLEWDMDVIIASPGLATKNGIAWVRFQPVAICHDAFYGVTEHGQGDSWVRLWHFDSRSRDRSKFYLWNHCSFLVQIYR